VIVCFPEAGGEPPSPVPASWGSPPLWAPSGLCSGPAGATGPGRGSMDVPPGSRLKTPALVVRCSLLQAGDLLVVGVESVDVVVVVQLAEGSGCNGGRSDGSKVLHSLGLGVRRIPFLWATSPGDRLWAAIPGTPRCWTGTRGSQELGPVRTQHRTDAGAVDPRTLGGDGILRWSDLEEFRSYLASVAAVLRSVPAAAARLDLRRSATRLNSSVSCDANFRIILVDSGRDQGAEFHAERRPDSSGVRYVELGPEPGWGALVMEEVAGEGETETCETSEKRLRAGAVGETLRLKLWESTTNARMPRVHWEGGSLSGVPRGIQPDGKVGVSRDGGLPRDRGPGCRGEEGLDEALGEASTEAKAVAAAPTNEGLRVRMWALSNPAEGGGGRLLGTKANDVEPPGLGGGRS
ncbi:hypothetical protein CRUP_013824, partial [Coryphaenoides rupestris]